MNFTLSTTQLQGQGISNAASSAGQGVQNGANQVNGKLEKHKTAVSWKWFSLFKKIANCSVTYNLVCIVHCDY